MNFGRDFPPSTATLHRPVGGEKKTSVTSVRCHGDGDQQLPRITPLPDRRDDIPPKTATLHSPGSDKTFNQRKLSVVSVRCHGDGDEKFHNMRRIEPIVGDYPPKTSTLHPPVGGKRQQKLSVLSVRCHGNEVPHRDAMPRIALLPDSTKKLSVRCRSDRIAQLTEPAATHPTKSVHCDRIVQLPDKVATVPTKSDRIALLPDQLYEEDNVGGESVSGSDPDSDFREQYAREVRKIRENIRAIRKIKSRSVRSSASSSHLVQRKGGGNQLKGRSVSCWQLEQQRPSRVKDTSCHRDASSSNEAVHLQQRLRSLSSELVTLRNRLHVTGGGAPPSAPLNGHSLAAYQQELSKQGGTNVTMMRHSVCAEVQDLIHLPGPLTEDAVLRTLHARFFNREYFTNVGPILLSVNPYQDVGNPLTLSSAHAASRCPQLLRVIHEAVRQQSETGYPQAIILSGESGSGKTYSSMLLLRQLFDVAGGGPETDAFKHLAAAFTVLRSLGSAKTANNSESSRIGHFIEVQVTDGALYRTKIHCYFLDQTRVIRLLPNEKNYHIFYQMLAGLTQEERAQLSLDGYSLHNLCYLNQGDCTQNETEDASRFEAWKTCLSVLGIPSMDVVRVLAAILLLGNIQFIDGAGMEVDIKGGNAEMKAVATLLGVSSVALFRGLTTRTHNVRGQLVKSLCDATLATITRDALSKALYCRTVATIVRRANSLKRLGSTSGTLSSDSNESVHNQTENSSQHASTMGSGGVKASKSMTVLNSAVRHATDGFIGILDMFGFEASKPSHLEHLCINLCAETLQHFYNTHVFKSSIESCREEGVHSDLQVDYVDNVPCIDLISSLRTGLLSMLDVECSVRGSPDTYLKKVIAQHHNSPRFHEDTKSVNGRVFGIRHFAGRVPYDTAHFLETNRDVVPDDIVAVFHKTICNFGFATHLFGSELKALYSQETVPRGVSFRISPTAHTDLQNGDEPVSTLTQDFHSRLDNLLRTLVHAKPHFIRCIKTNNNEQPNHFDRGVVVQQIRALQVLETVNLMAGGFPHRMRFKAFNIRYRLIAPFKKLKRTDDKAIEDCKLILECFMAVTENCRVSNASTAWALGKRHIFLSEGSRQQLELLRVERRHNASVLVQAVWRGWNFRRKRWPTLKRNLHTQARTRVNRPRPQPIAGTPPPDLERCDQKTIQQTCSLFGLDLERPPPVPPSRSYTVTGNTKMGYPQARVMKMNYSEDNSGEVTLHKGETVMVVRASARRGHLVVEHKTHTIHVPYQFLELKPSEEGGVNI